MKNNGTSEIKSLMDWRLNYDEAVLLLQLIKRLKIPDEDIQSFNENLQLFIPFEGGMMFEEAVIGAKLSVEDIPNSISEEQRILFTQKGVRTSLNCCVYCKQTFVSLEPMDFCKQKCQTNYEAKANKNNPKQLNTNLALVNDLVEVDETTYVVNYTNVEPNNLPKQNEMCFYLLHKPDNISDTRILETKTPLNKLNIS